KKAISWRDNSPPSRFFRMMSCGLKLFLVGKQNNCLRADSFAATDCIEAFASLRFHTRGTRFNLQSSRDIFAHCLDVVSKLWPLQHHDRISIDDMKSAFVSESNNVGEHFETVCVFPLRIAVRKVNAYVPVRHRAQNRIDQSM